MNGPFKVGDPVSLRVFRLGMQRAVVTHVYTDSLGFGMVVRLDKGAKLRVRPSSGGSYGGVRHVDAITRLGELA